MARMLKDQLAAIQTAAVAQGKSSDFLAMAVLFWMEWELNFSLAGNGWLDNDDATREAISENPERTAEFKQFLRDAGIVGWYNQTPEEEEADRKRIERELAARFGTT